MAAAALLAIVALFLPLRLRVTLRRDRKENFLAVTLILVAGINVSVFRVPRRAARHVPQNAGRREGGEVSRARPGRGAFVRLRRATIAFLKEAFLSQKHECQRLDLTVRLGAGDPAITAFLSGASWAAGGPILAFIQRYLYFATRPRIRVIPAFDGYRLDVLADCIVKVNPGYIILRSIMRRLARSFRRRITARGRASHRRPDEDRDAEHQGNDRREHNPGGPG